MASSTVDTLIRQLREGLEALLAEAREEGRNEIRSQLSGIVSGPARRSGGRRKAAAPKARAAKPAGKKKRKSPWATMSDEDYIARVNAIRKGRGMAALTAAEAAEKIAERKGGGKKKRKKRKSAWDTYTPEQRKAHLAALKAGRKKAAAKRKRKRR